jgi:hypothetical protein
VVKVVRHTGARVKLYGWTGGAVVSKVDAGEEEIRVVGATVVSSLAVLRVPGSSDLFRAVAVMNVEVHHGYPLG